MKAPIRNQFALITILLFLFACAHSAAQTQDIIPTWVSRVVELEQQARTFFGKKQYSKAVNTLNKAIDMTPINLPPKYVNGAAGVWSSMSWYLIFERQFDSAVTVAQKAVLMSPDKLWMKGNLAHAYLLSGKRAEAEAIYFKYIGQPIPEQDNHLWQNMILEDINTMKQAGLSGFETIADSLGSIIKAEREKARIAGKLVARISTNRTIRQSEPDNTGKAPFEITSPMVLPNGQKPIVQSKQFFSFSHDGDLIAGYSQVKGEGIFVINIWDVFSGEKLRESAVKASFNYDAQTGGIQFCEDFVAMMLNGDIYAYDGETEKTRRVEVINLMSDVVSKEGSEIIGASGSSKISFVATSPNQQNLVIVSSAQGLGKEKETNISFYDARKQQAIAALEISVDDMAGLKNIQHFESFKIKGLQFLEGNNIVIFGDYRAFLTEYSFALVLKFDEIKTNSGMTLELAEVAPITFSSPQDFANIPHGKYFLALDAPIKDERYNKRRTYQALKKYEVSNTAQKLKIQRVDSIPFPLTMGVVVATPNCTHIAYSLTDEDGSAIRILSWKDMVNQAKKQFVQVQAQEQEIRKKNAEFIEELGAADQRVEAKQKQLRASVRAGDRCSKGLIIKVQGQNVLVQPANGKASDAKWHNLQDVWIADR